MNMNQTVTYPCSCTRLVACRSVGKTSTCTFQYGIKCKPPAISSKWHNSSPIEKQFQMDLHTTILMHMFILMSNHRNLCHHLKVSFIQIIITTMIQTSDTRQYAIGAPDAVSTSCMRDYSLDSWRCFLGPCPVNMVKVTCCQV